MKNNKLLIAAALAALGVLLLLVPNMSDKKQDAGGDGERLAEYSTELEEKIASLCAKVKGVSIVTVSVYFDTGFETVYACNEESKATSNGYNTEKKYVTVGSGSGESMVLVFEKMPNICGVAVVCGGGGDPYISKEIISIISSAYGVSTNKIYVAEGKK